MFWSASAFFQRLWQKHTIVRQPVRRSGSRRVSAISTLFIAVSDNASLNKALIDIMLTTEFVQLVLLFGSGSIFFLFVVLGIVLKVTTTPFPKIVRHRDEEYYKDPDTGDNRPFASLEDTPTLKLSVIVPAFDEEKRLPAMLDECLAYLQARSAEEKDFTYEVIIVSDGSRDRTVKVAMKYVSQFGSDSVRVLNLIENRGKGGAVRLGMLSSRGQFLLFADADGATKFADYEKLERSMGEMTGSDWKRDALAIGSRAHLEEEATAKRTIFRTILMHGFHFLVWTFAVKKIRDTQCGFKLVSRSAARKLFQVMHVERWAFDVELLFIAQSYNIPIAEVAVNWTEIEGSKLTPFWSWLQMGRDLMLIWFRYAIGAWQLRKEHSN